MLGVNFFVFAGELFAQAPVDQYPGCVVEAVTDSSRYFVIRIEDGNGKATLKINFEINVKLFVAGTITNVSKVSKYHLQ